MVQNGAKRIQFAFPTDPRKKAKLVVVLSNPPTTNKQKTTHNTPKPPKKPRIWKNYKSINYPSELTHLTAEFARAATT